MKNLVDKYSYRVVWSEDDEAFIAHCLEFPSVKAHGSSQEKAIAELRKAVRASIKWMQDEGESVPTPIGASKFSGKFNVRIPPDLHRELVEDAEEQGVSLNQLVTYRLACKGANDE